MSNKKAIAMLLLALMMLIAACGSGKNNAQDSSSSSAGSSPSGSSATSSAPAETIELRMTWWGSDARHEKTLKVIELFEQKNPGIKITPEYSGFDGYFDKLNTQIAAGNAPDLIQMGGNIREYIDKNALLDLSPYVGNVLNLEDFSEGLLKKATVDNKFYGVTLGVSTFGLLYNATMFEKAGVPLPSENWTYEDFKNAAVTISRKLGPGHYGTYDLSSGNNTSGLSTFLLSNGKELYRDGDRRFDRQDMIDWFTLWDDMRKAGAVTPPDVMVANPPGEIDKSLIVQGKVAIQAAAASQIYGFQELTQDKLGLLVFPVGSKGSGHVTPDPGQYMTGYAKTEHPEAVAKFINFMVNDPDAALILGNDRGVPPSGKIRDLLAAQSTPTDKVLYDFVSTVSRIASDVDYQQFPLDNELLKLYQVTGEKIAFGAQSIDAAVDEFMTEIDKLIVKAKAQ
jgi:multiple sugar transport system substrate-binding protein